MDYSPNLETKGVGISQSVQQRATGWMAEESEFISLHGQEIFVFPAASRRALGPIKSPMQWVPGAFSSGLKWQGREADLSPPSSAEDGGAIPPIPHTPSLLGA
jgi:hypothetical protein